MGPIGALKTSDADIIGFVNSMYMCVGFYQFGSIASYASVGIAYSLQQSGKSVCPSVCHTLVLFAWDDWESGGGCAV